MRDLAIVIVSWNTRQLVQGCLRALGDPAGQACQIIVVDNASTDGSADSVATDFPFVTLIRNAENAGFARANNQGIAASSSRYVVLLNSDALASGQTLLALTKWMDAHADVGICSPRLLTPSGEAQAYAFGGDPSIGYLFKRGLKRLSLQKPLHDWETKDEQRVDWVSGACMLIRRAVIEQIGGMDENIFMYFEDNDLCLRARQRGWGVAYLPQFAITHVGGQSIKQSGQVRTAYQDGLRYFYRKHYPVLAQKLLAFFLPVYVALSPVRGPIQDR